MTYKKLLLSSAVLVFSMHMSCMTEELSINQAEQDGSIVVGVSQVGAESDWRIANSNSIRETFNSADGYFLLFEDAQQKQEKQLKTIRKYVLQDVDYIVLNPIVETGWDLVLQEAKDAGIPVIIADRQVKASKDLYTCWIGSDFYREALHAAEWLEQYLADQGRADEEIHIVTLQGTTGSSAQIGRTMGFQEILNNHKNWIMLDKQDADFTQAKGKEVMEQYLMKYDSIDVVVSENDNMTFGAIEAIKEAGKTCGPDGDIIILSFDAVKAALEHMKSGDINADFECNPLHGKRLKEIIEKLENGEEVDKIQYIEETYFDPTMDLDAIMQTRAY